MAGEKNITIVCALGLGYIRESSGGEIAKLKMTMMVMFSMFIASFRLGGRHP